MIKRKIQFNCLLSCIDFLIIKSLILTHAKSTLAVRHQFTHRGPSDISKKTKGNSVCYKWSLLCRTAPVPLKDTQWSAGPRRCTPPAVTHAVAETPAGCCSDRSSENVHIIILCHMTMTSQKSRNISLLTLTGLNRINSVSLLARYKDMLCNVPGTLFFNTRYVAITMSLILAKRKHKE